MSEMGVNYAHRQAKSGSADARWLDVYQIPLDPFSSKVSCFYSGAQRRQRLETLRHLSFFSDQVLLLLGEAGSGKTRLVDELLADSSGLRPVLLRAEQLTDVSGVMAAISSDLELGAHSSEADWQVAFIADCRESLELGHRVLIIVDNGESLTDAQFDFVMERLRPDLQPGLFGMVVVAESSITEQCQRWSQHLGTDVWQHSLHLPPLNPVETAEYLSLRLSAAGWQGRPPLREQDVARIAQKSCGNPARIAEVATEVLLSQPSSAMALKPIPGGYWRWMVFATLLLAVSFVFVAYQYRDESTGAPAQQVDMARVGGEISRLPVSPEPATVDVRQDATFATPEEVRARPSLSLPQIEERATSSVDHEGKIIRDEILDLEQSAAARQAGPIAIAADEPVIAMPKERPSVAKSESVSQSVEAKVLSATNSVDQPALAGLAPQKVTEPLAALPTESLVEDVAVQKAVMPTSENGKTLVATAQPAQAKVINTKAESGSEKQQQGLRESEWVLRQPKNYFAIQLLGTFELSSAENFINSHKDLDDLYIVQISFKKKDWFVVLHGLYPSATVAQNTLEAYPASLKKQNPWIRKIKGLQDEVRKSSP